MNSDKILTAIDEPDDDGPYICDYCEDPTEQSVFVNFAKDSAVCWNCIRRMHKQLDRLKWIHGTDWDKLPRH